MYTEQLNYMEKLAKSKTGLESIRHDIALQVETTDFMAVVFNFNPGPTLRFSLRAKRAGGICASVRSKVDVPRT